MKNKGWRQEVKMRHFKRRLKMYGYDQLPEGLPANSNPFRTTGKPCSCWMCRGESYSRKIKHKQALVPLLAGG